ncbi:hypothetical protein GJ496_000553, partial [Pomphorhynchus laevis]
INKCSKQLDNELKSATPMTESKENLVNGVLDKSNLQVNLPLTLKYKLSGWECSVCLVNNSEDINVCACCTTPRTTRESSVVSNSTQASDSSTKTDLSNHANKTEPPWFCTICMKVQKSKTDLNKCADCGAARKSTTRDMKLVSFEMPKTNSLASPGIFSNASVPNTMLENEIGDEDSKHADGDEDVNEQQVDHCEKDAIFASKCKMYYKKDEKYLPKSVGFLNILYDGTCGKKLLFRADNFNGSTMLTTKVTSMMNPTLLKEKNVMLLTIAYPQFYENQDVTKPIVVLFKMKSNEDANKLMKSLQS